MKRRVVVTGIGLVSPLGLTANETWNALLKGQSGIDEISSFDTSSFSVKIGAEIKQFDPLSYFSSKELKKMDRFIQLGVVASEEAIKDSGLEINDQIVSRFGVLIGSGIGGLGTIENTVNTLTDLGPRKISPFFVPASVINMVSGYVSMKYGLRGPNLAVATSCSSGAHSIAMASRMVAYGDADIMLAGGAESAIVPIGLGGFSAARALSKRNDEPEKASRPFDSERDGFVLGEGSAILVLEPYERAKQRDARIYGEITGVGMSGDAYHITMPHEQGEGAKLAMEAALKEAALGAAGIDYINAHGTATVSGDVAESLAIEKLFGSDTPNIPVSSTKSMLGHSLGATGAVEAAISLMCIQDNAIPPTINLDNPDPECRLKHVANTARSVAVNRVLSNSFAFGGTNVSLLFQSI
ncbi:MAG: beta-ketoacyl-ACP synthase II [Pseudomonadota bacterium]